ncbi:NADAR family protein [Kribbella sp. NPDC051718]|uniref:NADAR family protein n=1 Tax=Kribbella sp. NPDC051718 TaxID=3155168 RepID=UPI003420E7C0
MVSGELEYLSNFSKHYCTLDGLIYLTVENAFQAAKVSNPTERAMHGFTHCSPREAKRIGRSIELRRDWEQIKLPLMRQLLASKFSSNLGLAERLVATGNLDLVETNTWHDQIWGSCVCDQHIELPGQNLLGVSLQWLRYYLAGCGA